MNPYLEKIYNQITADLAKMLFEIVNNYPGHEPEICRLMTAQLGSYISISAKDPKAALLFYANRLAAFDWQGVRSDYFANTLGVNNTVPTRKPLAEVRNIVASGPRLANSEPPAANTGDPLAKKPD